jgi:hypothetical protein
MFGVSFTPESTTRAGGRGHAAAGYALAQLAHYCCLICGHAGIPKCIIYVTNIRRRRSFVNEMAIQIYRHRNDDDAVRRHMRRTNGCLATAAAIRPT